MSAIGLLTYVLAMGLIFYFGFRTLPFSIEMDMVSEQASERARDC